MTLLHCYYFTSEWWIYLLLPAIAFSGFLLLIYFQKNRHKPLPFFAHLPTPPHHSSKTVRASNDGLILYSSTSPYPFFVPVCYSQGMRVFGVFVNYTRVIFVLLVILLGIFLVRTYDCVQQHEELVGILDDTIQKASPAAMPKYPSQLYKGRGIVFCGGGRRQLSLIYASIYVLREVLKSDLPIEVFHIGQGEMTHQHKTLLENKFEDVRVRDVFSFDVDEQWRDIMMKKDTFNLEDGRVGLKRIFAHSKFPVKPFALLLSSFQEVVMMDFDAIPVKDPALLFEDQGYREKGNIFWKDVDLNKPDREFFKAVQTVVVKTGGNKWKGTKDFSFEETETGQWVVDKRRCWAGVYASWLLNSRPEVVMRYMHGDKDSFFFGFLLAQLASGKHSVTSSDSDQGDYVPSTLAFHHMQRPPAFAGFYNREKKTMSYSAFVHYDAKDQPFFFHHTGVLGKRSIEALVEDPLKSKGTGAGYDNKRQQQEEEVANLLLVLSEEEGDKEQQELQRQEQQQLQEENGGKVLWTDILVWTKHSQSWAYEKRTIYQVEPGDKVVAIPKDLQVIGARYVDAIQHFYSYRS